MTPSFCKEEDKGQEVRLIHVICKSEVLGYLFFGCCEKVLYSRSCEAASDTDTERKLSQKSGRQVTRKC